MVGRDEAFDILRSRSHGHVAAVLGTLGQLRLDRLVGPQRSPERNGVLAMIVASVLEPGSPARQASAAWKLPKREHSSNIWNGMLTCRILLSADWLDVPTTVSGHAQKAGQKHGFRCPSSIIPWLASQSELTCLEQENRDGLFTIRG